MTEVALGTRVTYHHRAAVARYRRQGTSLSFPVGWSLFEGARRHYYTPDFKHEPDLFAKQPEQKTKYGIINKTVMIWPEEGSGVIIGRCKRQRGISVPNRGNGEDFDPGYFDARDSFRLYMIRHELDEKDYILVPEWAVHPV